MTISLVGLFAGYHALRVTRRTEDTTIRLHLARIVYCRDRSHAPRRNEDILAGHISLESPQPDSDGPSPFQSGIPYSPGKSRCEGQRRIP